MSQPPAETDEVAQAIDRARALIGLAIVIGEAVYLIDTRMLTQPSRIAAWVRRHRPRVQRWWARSTAAGRARELAPEVWWEAWCATNGERP